MITILYLLFSLFVYEEIFVLENMHTAKLHKQQYRFVLPLYCNQALGITNHKWHLGKAGSFMCFTADSQHEFPSTFVITKLKPLTTKGSCKTCSVSRGGGKDAESWSTAVFPVNFSPWPHVGVIREHTEHRVVFFGASWRVPHRLTSLVAWGLFSDDSSKFADELNGVQCVELAKFPSSSC